MTIEVKICGINDPAAFDAAVAAGADWVGFVFFARSPRFVTPQQAAALSRRHPGGPQRVGLFVDPSDAAVAEALAALPLDALQLYADPARAAALGTRFGVPAWRAVAVAATTSLPPAEPGIERFVLEAKPPPGATRPGGNAARFDWSLLAGWRPAGPWMLAGGLSPANVAEAIAATGAPAVDVSSGVETRPGVKSPDLIHRFTAAARAADPALSGARP